MLNHESHDIQPWPPKGVISVTRVICGRVVERFDTATRETQKFPAPRFEGVTQHGAAWLNSRAGIDARDFDDQFENRPRKSTGKRTSAASPLPIALPATMAAAAAIIAESEPVAAELIAASEESD